MSGGQVRSCDARGWWPSYHFDFESRAKGVSLLLGTWLPGISSGSFKGKRPLAAGGWVESRP